MSGRKAKLGERAQPLEPVLDQMHYTVLEIVFRLALQKLAAWNRRGFALSKSVPSESPNRPLIAIAVSWTLSPALLKDGHHNLNCAKLKQAKLKLKLCES